MHLKKWLKEITLIALLVFVLSNVVSYLRSPVLKNNALPPLSVTLIDKREFSTHTREDRPLLIHLWATWCPVCKLEASNIQSISEKYEVLTIAVRSGSDEDIQRYMQENALNFNVLNDANGMWSQTFGVEVFPTTFIFDAKGALRFSEVGYTTTVGLLGRLLAIE
jgi:thiol-disulfide isomerase/thioredoxin